jgi:hypothetical protein
MTIPRIGKGLEGIRGDHSVHSGHDSALLSFSAPMCNMMTPNEGNRRAASTLAMWKPRIGASSSPRG